MSGPGQIPGFQCKGSTCNPTNRPFRPSGPLSGPHMSGLCRATCLGHACAVWAGHSRLVRIVRVNAQAVREAPGRPGCPFQKTGPSEPSARAVRATCPCRPATCPGPFGPHVRAVRPTSGLSGPKFGTDHNDPFQGTKMTPFRARLRMARGRHTRTATVLDPQAHGWSTPCWRPGTPGRSCSPSAVRPFFTTQLRHVGRCQWHLPHHYQSEGGEQGDPLMPGLYSLPTPRSKRCRPACGTDTLCLLPSATCTSSRLSAG